MRTLVFGLIFGLLAVVHSSPFTYVTQMPSKAEDEILQAVTNGFLIDFPGLTSESPKKNTTVPASQQTSTVSVEKDFEGSASGDLFPPNTGVISTTTTTAATTTTSTASQQTSTGSGVKDFDGSGSGDLFPPHKSEPISTTTTTTTTTTSHQSSPVPGENDSDGSGSGDLFPPHKSEPISTTTITTTATTTTTSRQSSPVPGENDSEGSGSGDLFPPFKGKDSTTTTTSTTTTGASQRTPSVPGETPFEGRSAEETNGLLPTDEVHSTPQPTPAAPIGREGRMLGVPGISGEKNPASPDTQREKDVNSNTEPQKGQTETHKGHTTPGWIIIVAFIVGLAALIMICVAIATRDKWNRPKQATPLGNNTNSTNQQKGQEMETFLPKENGKSSEYTVIPLDELPEKDSSD